MKTVLITGASGNLGQAVADKFQKEGCDVVKIVSPKTSGERSQKPEKGSFPVDLLDDRATSECLQYILKTYKRINSAVLTVGGFAAANLQDTTLTDIHEQIRLNFDTAFNIAKPLHQHMTEAGGGRIFLIGSRPGLELKHGKTSVAYAMAKSLVFRLAEVLNIEGAIHNVVANVIVPSTIDTPQNRKDMPDADYSKWVSPASIAEIIYFYSSDDSANIREPVVKVYGSV